VLEKLVILLALNASTLHLKLFWPPLFLCCYISYW